MTLPQNPESATLDSSSPFVAIPTHAMTLEGFRQWARSEQTPEHARLSFVEQQILIDTTNESLDSHVKVKTAVAATLFPLVQSLDLGEFFTDGVLVTNAKADVSNNPDSLFVSWESYDSGRVRRLSSTGDQVGNNDEAHELEGSPDWVLEIVSRSSVAKDTRLLPAAYHASNITEFWQIDARGEPPQFLINSRGATEYTPAEQVSGWQKSAVFNRWFRLEKQTTSRGFVRFDLLVAEEPQK